MLAQRVDVPRASVLRWGLPYLRGFLRVWGVALLVSVGGCKTEPAAISSEASVAPFTAHLVLDHVRTISPEFTPESILRFPDNIHFDTKGHLIWDEGSPPVRVFDAEGGFIRTFGHPGAGPGELGRFIRLTIGPNGYFYVLDGTQRRVSVFTPDYEFAYSFPMDTGFVEQVAIDSQGNLLQLRESWWTDVRPAVVTHDTTGVLLAGWGEIPFSARVQVNLGGGGLVVDAQDNVYYGWISDHRIWKTDSEGTLLAVFDDKPAYYKGPDIGRLEGLDGKGSGELMGYFMQGGITHVLALILVPEKQLLFQHFVVPGRRIPFEVWHTDGFKIATDVQAPGSLIYADSDFLYLVNRADEEDENPPILVYEYRLEQEDAVVAP